MIKSIGEIVRDSEKHYTQETVRISDYVNFQMYQNIERINAYLNSKHISGETDSLGREKPFFNIVTAAVNIWYRATDLDRKNIRFIPTSQKSVPLAFVANVLLQKWMDKNRFGHFLNLWGRSLARYGSSVVKFIERNGELSWTVVSWNRFICDQIDFYALPRIEKLYKTPAQLRANKFYNQDKVNDLINTLATRRNLKGEQKDTNNDFIEIYEVHHEFPDELLKDDPDYSLDESEATFSQQMHVMSFVLTDDGYKDFELYRGRESRDPYMITHLIEEDGRTLSIGAVEYLFEAQHMTNHSVKNIKDVLDLASKLIFQTADTKYVGRNVLSAIETGDIFIHTLNMPLTRVANDKPDVSASINFGNMWQSQGREVTSTPDAVRGNTLPSGTPYSLGAYLGDQASSLFEIMTENKGLSLEDIVKEYIVPNLKKSLKNHDEVVAILDDHGIAEIDAMYVPQEAVKRYNKQVIQGVINGDFSPQNPVSPYVPTVGEAQVQEELNRFGNKRFLVPDIDDKTWDEMFSDFEWESVKVEITDENNDKKAVLKTLSTSLQTISAIASSGRQMTPDEKLILNQILAETGKISPLQIAKTSTPNPVMVGGGGGEINQ